MLLYCTNDAGNLIETEQLPNWRGVERGGEGSVFRVDGGKLAEAGTYSNSKSRHGPT